MGLKRKTTTFFFILTVIMVAALVGASLFSFRYFALSTAEDQARTAAEIVRVHLTESMVNGTIDKRKTFLDRLAAVKGLFNVRVVRGPGVVKQFGAGLKSEQQLDSIDKQVIQTAKPFFGLVDSSGNQLFRATIPYVAQSENEPHCLQCHQVAKGDVLGAISLYLSIEEQRDQAFLIVLFMALVIGLFAVVSMGFSRRLIKPLIDTAEAVQLAVHGARKGDFSARIQHQSDDEVGQIAKDLNILLVLLSKGLEGIAHKVAGLIRYNQPIGENQLATTIEMVESLEDVSRFKQAIEEDETKEEVYWRLSKVINDDFMIDHFSIYEVASSKNKLKPMVVDGVPGHDCCWCDPQILVRADACRAKRTGHVVDGMSTTGICTAFSPREDLEDAYHVCIPMIQSGSVGGVVQVVTDRDRKALACNMMPFIEVYLREAAPVLEAKRLMSTLRESALRDPMTGLHNRRFLQEYVDILVSYTDRNKSSFSVLMADLDYFKQINDTYGHEAGDATLKALAKTLTSCVRASDLVIRYGGEEFLIILRDTDPEMSLQVAEKIREAIENMKVELTGTVVQRTISVGVSGYPDDSSSFWQVVKYADVALYQAKDTGRNKVLRFIPEMWKEDDAY
ncbi:MAG: diguanylate cyclase [Candidatus Thiodiazotropha weberae]|uniref:diguanylate cyclase n=1 Tax=Candidatus Thiodiazotropha endoloripes TaxID=1818881 RepID=A0A1E2UIE2_9GAMM|nr:diguanylate cyclase [Candidatus Thiodiazotropha endoloripes]MCG7898762.1 diguanylate cyclase [Candidatus Thiodiazotropha weberae]MCG7901845.1 diguanylate cyclase [Candidatus Thiodiazotropha weberae]ODB83054.1 response regulator [Candidatus Thiodiazotropha endoloripes]ODB83421.1 response regulator [Candidatus Thiodiazotropha endoloripes]ODB91001.1 response regulator [Candidatus Thiodiazotropha endoloripes]